MRYLYTTKPDDNCHEVEKGIYGRPCHTSEQAKLRKSGWAYNINELRGTDYVRQGKEEGRQESQEVSDKPDPDLVAENDIELARFAYEQEFGKKPHHKMKLETIVAKLEESDDKG